MEQYCFDFIIEDEKKFTVSCLANSLDEAEQIFIANLDAGEYNYLIEGYEYECSDIRRFDSNKEETLC